MIDFRYHLVSLVAVFLALAVGIVLGSATLSGPISDKLTGDVTRLSADKRALESQVGELRTSLDASDQFAAAVAPRLVSGTLADRRVLLVTAPQTPGDLPERLVPVLRAAGARVTGTLQLLPALSDRSSSVLVEDLVAQVVPAGVELPEGEPVERATAELAAALVRPSAGKGVDPAEAQAVVSAFEEAELVRFDATGEVIEQADLAVVLTGERAQAPAPDGPAADGPAADGPAADGPAADGRAVDLEQSWSEQQQALLGLVRELDARSDGAVAAGPLGSAGDAGLLQLLRAEPAVARAVSSVDNADRGAGLVAVVLALAQPRAGQFGAGEGATAVLPAAAP